MQVLIEVRFLKLTKTRIVRNLRLSLAVCAHTCSVQTKTKIDEGKKPEELNLIKDLFYFVPVLTLTLVVIVVMT